jgi:hypothetical protein
MTDRIEELNGILDEVHDAYGGLRVDLSEIPEVRQRAFWSFDRLHPSELGHRALAARFAALLHQEGLHFPTPSLECSGPASAPRDNVRWMVDEVIPWLGRRAVELGPALALSAVRTLRTKVVAADAAAPAPATEPPERE